MTALLGMLIALDLTPLVGSWLGIPALASMPREWFGQRIALVAANVTRFSDFGVAPNTSYTYRVRAVNDGGSSDWSNEAGVTTLAGP